MFNLKDKIVYPGHGVAIIDEIIDKKVGNHHFKFFKLKFLYKETTILLPLNNIESCGIRFLSNNESIKKVFAMLYETPTKKMDHLDFTPSGWNRRNKYYQLKIQSGIIEDITSVYRELMNIAQSKELSFGEKKILITAEDLLVQEIKNVTNQTQRIVLDQLHSPFKQFLFSQSDVRQFSSAA